MPEKKTENSSREKIFAREKKQNSPLKIQKIPRNSKISLKKKINPRKKLKTCPIKLQNDRENLGKNGE